MTRSAVYWYNAVFIIVIMLIIALGVLADVDDGSQTRDVFVGFRQAIDPTVISTVNGTIIQEYDLIPVVRASIPIDALPELSMHPEVAFVEPDNMISLAGTVINAARSRFAGIETESLAEGVGSIQVEQFRHRPLSNWYHTNDGHDCMCTTRGFGPGCGYCSYGSRMGIIIED